jgi:hypothetical protein
LKQRTAKKHLDLNDPELFPHLGSQADMQTRNNSSSLSRRRINPTPVTCLTKSHPAVSSYAPSSLVFAVPEEEAPPKKSFAMAAAKGKDTTSNCQQVESGAINQLTESRALPLTTKTEYTSPVHPSLVYCVPQLERVGGLYAALIKGHWIANVFAEMYFVVQLLTVNSAGHLSHPVTAKTSLTLFHNISDCVYFATFVLGYLTE